MDEQCLAKTKSLLHSPSSEDVIRKLWLENEATKKENKFLEERLEKSERASVEFVEYYRQEQDKRETQFKRHLAALRKSNRDLKRKLFYINQEKSGPSSQLNIIGEQDAEIKSESAINQDKLEALENELLSLKEANKKKSMEHSSVIKANDQLKEQLSVLMLQRNCSAHNLADVAPCSQCNRNEQLVTVYKERLPSNKEIIKSLSCDIGTQCTLSNQSANSGTLEMNGYINTLQHRLDQLTAQRENLKHKLALREESYKHLEWRNLELKSRLKTMIAEANMLKKSLRLENISKRTQEIINLNGYKEKLNDHESENLALKNLLRLRNHEMYKLKRLLTEMTSKSGQIQEFMIDALEEVKAQITLENNQEHKKAVMVWKQNLLLGRSASYPLRAISAGRMVSSACSFPTLRSKTLIHEESRLTAEEPRTDSLEAYRNNRVKISQLSWKEKEKVLQKLFSKLHELEIAKGKDEDKRLEKEFAELEKCQNLEVFNFDAAKALSSEHGISARAVSNENELLEHMVLSINESSSMQTIPENTTPGEAEISDKFEPTFLTMIAE